MRHGPKNPTRVGEERREPGETAQPSADADLTDTQVMTMLDERRADGQDTHADEQTFSHIPLLRPEDPGTRLALKDAVQRGEPVSFAVQLLWSAQLIELDNMPRDPIFRSYTVYTTRVHSDGREWFELRLGFFADALSAKQVANYMQREYNSAAVVPVSVVEQSAARFAASSARVARHRAGADETATTVTLPAAEPAAAAPAARGRPPLFLVRRGGSRSA